MKYNKMLTLTKLIVILSVLFIVAIAAPYQELAPKAGYVPVYIREGNTPLSEIHPKLVEAFHEDKETSKLQVESIKSEEAAPVNNVGKKLDNKEDDEKVNEETNKSDLNTKYKIEEIVKEKKNKIAETTTDSDIAEFNADDLKTLIDDEAEN